MRRVLVIGSGGAGKSTASVRIGAALGLPVVHLDAHYWHPGWVKTPDDQWRAKVLDLLAEDAWVMDGNYTGTLDLRLAAADTVVFLDFPRLLCLARVLLRRWRFRGRSRPDMRDGCPERVPLEFLRWIWTYPRKRRPAVLARLQALPPETTVAVLHSQHEVDAFIARLRPDE